MRCEACYTFNIEKTGHRENCPANASGNEEVMVRRSGIEKETPSIKAVLQSLIRTVRAQDQRIKDLETLVKDLKKP